MTGTNTIPVPIVDDRFNQVLWNAQWIGVSAAVIWTLLPEPKVIGGKCQLSVSVGMRFGALNAERLNERARTITSTSTIEER